MHVLWRRLFGLNDSLEPFEEYSICVKTSRNQKLDLKFEKIFEVSPSLPDFGKPSLFMLLAMSFGCDSSLSAVATSRLAQLPHTAHRLAFRRHGQGGACAWWPCQFWPKDLRSEGCRYTQWFWSGQNLESLTSKWLRSMDVNNPPNISKYDIGYIYRIYKYI